MTIRTESCPFYNKNQLCDNKGPIFNQEVTNYEVNYSSSPLARPPHSLGHWPIPTPVYPKIYIFTILTPILMCTSSFEVSAPIFFFFFFFVNPIYHAENLIYVTCSIGWVGYGNTSSHIQLLSYSCWDSGHLCFRPLFGWQVVRYGIHLHKVGWVSLLTSVFID